MAADLASPRWGATTVRGRLSGGCFANRIEAAELLRPERDMIVLVRAC
jgi:hypothetical protein